MGWKRFTTRLKIGDSRFALVRLLSAVAFAALLSGCATTIAPASEDSKAPPTTPGILTEFVNISAEGGRDVQVNIVSTAGPSYPDFDVPESFLGGTVTVSWKATESVGDQAVYFFTPKVDIGSQTVPKSPTTFELKENDSRVLGATKVRVAPAGAAANVQMEFKVEATFRVVRTG
jgi:hypothetical protein